MIIQGTAITGTTVSSSAATVAADSYFNLVALLLPGNGTNGQTNNTFLDSSSNALTVTRSGNPTQGTFSPFSQTGWSNYFDGTGDFVSIPSSAQLSLTEDFTIEMFFFLNIATSGVAQGFIANGANSFSGTATALIYGHSSGPEKLSFFAYNILTGVTPVLQSSTTVVSGQWYHVAITRSGSTMRLFVNGQQEASYTSSATINLNTTLTKVGSYWGGDVNGYISNARVVKGTAVYTESTYTVPTAPLTAITNTSLLTCQSNRFIDNSTNAFAITVAGNTSVQAFAPFDPTAAYSAASVGGSAYLDGSGDYLTISNPASLLTFGTGDFTVECFVYPTAGSSSAYVCWIYGNTVDIVAISVNSNTGAVTFTLRGTNLSQTTVVGSTGLVRLNEWTHLALVRTGTNFYGYVNGTRFSTTIAANAAFNEAQAQFFTQPQIGASSNPVGNYFTGYVSGWRALKGTALYTAATITVPSAPLTAIANTSALLNSTNGGITDATAKNVLETVGSAQISTAQSKFGGSSMAFDGTGDGLSLPANQNISLGTGDFTIEMWVNGANSSSPVGGSFPRLFTLGTAQGAGCIEVYNSSSTGITVAISAGTNITFAGGTLLDSTWNHFAITRSGTSLKAFVNGTQVGSTNTNSTNLNLAASTQSWIGSISASAGNFTGYIDDFRITRGYARYTANFTAPTTAFPTQ